ncbi:MAG: hypothetical protein JW704_13945 [Anaerolineaceae bacterium]|nr:hypothetical protein [Anaerolineaceae bacterium]
MFKATFSDELLISEALPKVSIQIKPVYHYVGCSNFILYDVAGVEQHLFIQADVSRRVQLLLWFQFEGFLEDNQHSYHYPDMEEIQLGGMAFLHDTGLHDIDRDYLERPGSDSSHVVEHLRNQGYLYEGGSIFKRFVWLDPDKRNELMIIYSEYLTPEEYQADLRLGGKQPEVLPEALKALHTRAVTSFRIVEPAR